jgi:hypothetical protein
MADALETLRDRYGVEPEDDSVAVGRLTFRQNRLRARLDVIEEQLTQLATERRRLLEEDARIDLMRTALVDDVAEQIRRRHKEGWSPSPVTGYRVWAIADNRLQGATGRVWEQPQLDAECDRSRTNRDLPHTDRHCSAFGHGCGIYAAKDPARLEEGSTTWVLGIVHLSGKVVEHEHGYRAARGQVVAVAAQDEGRLLATCDPDRIADLFADPTATIRRSGTEIEAVLNGTALLEVVEDLEREMDRWT